MRYLLFAATAATHSSAVGIHSARRQHWRSKARPRLCAGQLRRLPCGSLRRNGNPQTRIRLPSKLLPTRPALRARVERVLAVTHPTMPNLIVERADADNTHRLYPEPEG